MGVAPGQSAFERQPTQVFVAGSHAGELAGQSELARQATHLFAVVSHLGVAPEQ